MKRSVRRLLLACCFSAGLAITYQTELRNAGAQESGNTSRQKLDDGIPPAALLTDRGRELAENLKSLRRTRATLGPKHPTLPVVEQAISETERHLRAWLPNELENENPFKNRDSVPQNLSQAARTDSGHASINDTDLRQLVLRLHARVETLEARVRKLERSQE